LRTWSPPRPRKSIRFWTPRTLPLLYLTPWRCSGLCCQLFPPNGFTLGR
jgi:hypothetical protein